MLQSPLHFSTVRSVLLTFLTFLLFNIAGYSKTSEDIISSKADFILEVAYNIYYEETTDANEFVIGVYGRDSESKAIFTKLNTMVRNLTIDKKKIKIKLFKSMRSVQPVDVIFISGSAKIRLGDLHEKLSENNYSMITENYPFGTSAINFSMDNEDNVMFEIQETSLRKNGATLRRQLLKNRQRITSAKMWDAKISGKVIKNSDESTIELADTMALIEVDTIIADTVNGPLLAEREWTELDTCKKEKENVLAAANKKFNWLLVMSILIIAGLSFYIVKLRKNKGL